MGLYIGGYTGLRFGKTKVPFLGFVEEALLWKMSHLNPQFKPSTLNRVQ